MERCMRKVILYIAASLDGYIARQDGSIDWLPDPTADFDYGYDELLGRIDTVLMGRTTYEQVRGFGDYPYAGMQGIVFSRKRAGELDEYVRFTDEDPAELIGKLRREEGKHLWLVGGGELIASFLDHDLVDEFHIFTVPVLLGKGIPLFDGPYPELALRLEDVTSWPTGLVRTICGRTR